MSPTGEWVWARTDYELWGGRLSGPTNRGGSGEVARPYPCPWLELPSIFQMKEPILCLEAAQWRLFLTDTTAPFFADTTSGG